MKKNFAETLFKIERIRFIVVFFLVGLLFTVFGTIVTLRPTGEYIKAEATVIELEEPEYDFDTDTYRYYGRISYTVDGNTYESDGFPIKETTAVGDTVAIEYPELDPSSVGTPGSRYLPVIFIVIGIASMVGSVVFAVRGAKSAKAPEWDAETVNTQTGNAPKFSSIREQNEWERTQKENAASTGNSDDDFNY